jgi:hypothetical protein
VCLVLEIPQAAAAVRDLLGAQWAGLAWLNELPHRMFAVLGAFGLIALLVRSLYRSGRLWVPLYPLAKFRLAPVGRPHDLGGYRDLISRQRPLLQITTKEVAQRAGIYLWEAAYLCANPSFIPRQDVQARIRTAMMVPSNWPRRGYGPQCTKERLAWYATKRQVAWTAHQLETMTPRDRAQVLRLLENELLAGLFGTRPTS